MKRLHQLTRFALLGLAVGLSACRGSTAPPDAPPRPAIDVTVSPSTLVDTAEQLDAGGAVAARQSATVSARILATILDVRVKAGDHVAAGDVLVTLDARDISEHTRQARASAAASEKLLAQARTARGAAEAEHRLAAAWQTRIAALHERRSATDQERDEADARLAAAAAKLAGATAGIEAADAQLASARAGVGAAAATESFATVRAPFAGLVTERLTDPGNLAAPGVPLLRLEADGAREVVVRIDEARATWVRPGDRVRVVIGPHPGGTDEPSYDGVVAEVARAIDADRRAFTVKVTIPPGVTARSGSFARVAFRGATRRVVLVPIRAIRRHGQVSTVYVVQDGVARLRLIQAGASTSEGVEVLAGLDAGEPVVTSPPASLADGARVATRGRPVPAGDTR